MVIEGEIVQQLMSPQFFEDPYPTYRAMREMSPALFLAPLNAWILTGFDEAYTALRRHDVFSSTIISGQGAELGADQVALISDDPPRHTRLRGLVNKAFTPKRVHALEPWIEGIVKDLIDDFGPGDVDLAQALAVPLPVTVIAELLGIDPARRDDFKRWSDAVLDERTEENAAAQMAKIQEMGDYFAQTIAARRQAPASDLFSALTQADVNGQRLEDWESAGLAVLLLVAGNETTTNLISNMLNILARRPDVWARLRADRSLVDPAIEETLRVDSPVQVLQRITKDQFDMNGAVISKGQQVYVGYGAANRDPRAFADPDEFRLDRELSRHLAFGHGIHFCLGAPLARTEARLAVNALLDRYESVRETAEPPLRQHTSMIVRGFTKLPLRFA